MKREEYISDEQVVKRANAAIKIELEKKKAILSGSITFSQLIQLLMYIVLYQESPIT